MENASSASIKAILAPWSKKKLTISNDTKEVRKGEFIAKPKERTQGTHSLSPSLNSCEHFIETNEPVKDRVFG